jgi:transposase
MEACYSSNAWGRAIQTLGHQVKLIPPHQVKPFVVGNKNDHNDALAIAEASLRPSARFVPVKTLSQQDLQALDRIRSRLVKTRTGVINQLRGFLSEYGICVPKGVAKLHAHVPAVLEAPDNGLTPVAREFMHGLYEEITALNQRIAAVEKQTAALMSQHPDYERLLSISGVGKVTAGALLAAVGDAKHFKNGRAMAAWMGLAPSLRSSGEVHTLGGISKRGNNTLRRLFIHGARSVINYCHGKTDSFSQWMKALLARMHPCKAIVAVANKLARIAWAVLTKQIEFSAALAAR